MYKIDQADSKTLDIIRSKLSASQFVLVLYVLVFCEGLHDSVINGYDVKEINKLCNQLPQSVGNLVCLSLLFR